MSTPSLKLRLGPRPKTSQTKVTFNCTTVLLEDLQHYAAQYAQAYGEPIDVAELVPHMLATFMARDRAFRRAGQASRSLRSTASSNAASLSPKGAAPAPPAAASPRPAAPSR